MKTRNQILPLTLALAGLVFTSTHLHSQTLLAVDFGSAPSGVEPGFVGQTSYSQTHSTTAGDITVAISDNPQGFYVFAGGGTNPAIFDDFIFDNSGPMTLTLSGPGISANTEYALTFWSYYGVQARNTTFTAVSGTTGDTLGPIAWDHPTTSPSDNSASGTFTSDGSGNLTFSLGSSRPAINALTIGSQAADPGFNLSITPNGSNYDFEWNSKDDKVYDLVSATDLTNAPDTWPVYMGHADIAGTAPTTMLGGVPGADPERFFAVVEKDPPPPDIQNASFEDPVMADDALGALGTPWTEFDDDELGILNTWNPPVTEYAAVPDGENVATVWFDTVPNATFGISQVLGATFAAGTDYTVTVQVGRATNFDWPGFRVELWAGATLLAFDEDPTTTAPGAGSFVTSTVSYDDATAAPATPGDALEIRLLSRGVDVGSVSPSANGWGVEFDQVTFSATGP